jgi:hypothetical protein
MQLNAVERKKSVRYGSNAAGPADPTCRLMSGLLRKRPNLCETAKCREGPIHYHFLKVEKAAFENATSD